MQSTQIYIFFTASAQQGNDHKILLIALSLSIADFYHKHIQYMYFVLSTAKSHTLTIGQINSNLFTFNRLIKHTLPFYKSKRNTILFAHVHQSI